MQNKIRNILVKTVEHCNLGCRYCYAAAPECLPAAVSSDFVCRVFRELTAGGCLADKVTLIWHGGEPTLFPAAKVRKIQEEISRIAENNRINVKFSLQTNGYCIPDEWIALLRDWEMHCGVSLDGPADIHNQSRVTQNGKPSYDEISQNLERLKAAGISFALLSVIDERHLGRADEYCEWMTSHGQSVRLNPRFGNGTQIWEGYFAFLRQTFCWRIKQDASYPSEPLDGLLKALLARIKPGECSFGGECDKHFICICPEERIGICGRQREKVQALPGEVVEKWKLLREKLAVKRDEFRQQAGCDKCQYCLFCNGFCPAAHEGQQEFVHFCLAFRNFMDFLRKEGLLLLKDRLVEEKNNLRLSLRENRQILNALMEEEGDE